MNEHIRTWTEGEFRLELYDTHGFDAYSGKSRLAYELFHRDGLIFEGDDFFPSPLHAIDSDDTVGCILTFLSLRPGDTDADYFERYTPEQLDFADQYGDELSLYAYELENPGD